MDFVVFIFALAIILLGAELFTNGIEWFGHRLNLGEGAVGSVLAAVATALPETLIPVIAIIGPILAGTEASVGSEEVGVGAILGAPFTLATLAMFITGHRRPVLRPLRPPWARHGRERAGHGAGRRLLPGGLQPGHWCRLPARWNGAGRTSCSSSSWS